MYHYITYCRICKFSLREIFTNYPSETFLNYGKEKVERAVEVYNKFFSKEATEDIETYVIKESL